MDRPKIEDFRTYYTSGNAELCSTVKQYSKAQDLYIEHLKKQLLLHSVIISEIRVNKEFTRLIDFIPPIEDENIGKCADMKIRDVVNTCFNRLTNLFRK